MADDKDKVIDPKDVGQLKEAKTVLEDITDVLDRSRIISKKKREEIEREASHLKEINDLTAKIAEKKKNIEAIERNIVREGSVYKHIQQNIAENQDKLNKSKDVYSKIQKNIEQNESKLSDSQYKGDLIKDQIKQQNILLAQKEAVYQKEIASGKVTERTKYARLREINAIKDIVKAKDQEIKKEEWIQSNLVKKIAGGLNAKKQEEENQKILHSKIAGGMIVEKQKERLLRGLREELGMENDKLKRLEQEKITKQKNFEISKNITATLEAADEFLSKTGDNYGKIKTLITDIAKGGATAWLAVIKASLDRWIELDKAALEFRKQTGFLVSQTKELDKAAREVNVQMANLGVNIGEAYAAAGALTEEFQVIGLVTKEAIANTAMVAANLGIGVAESAKFKGMFESIAESSGTTADGAIKSAAALAKMGGVAPVAVMKDMATASGETLSFLAKSPMALMRAAVEARRLGTTVGALSKSARGFLNYQDSITSELEASALLGKALNFQEARAAAYAGDVVKSRELALKQIAKAGDFTKLNVYQQEALAKAAGMTVDEVIKQQNQQKLLAKLEATRPELYAKYKAMQEKIRENEKAAAGDLEKQAEEMAKQQLMQAEMNKLTNAFSSIWTDITDALLPIANTIMPVLITTVRGLAVIFKIIGGLVRGLFSPIEKFFDSFRSGNESALKLEEIFAKIGPTVEKITAFAVGLTGTLMHAVTGVATMYAMMIPVVNIFSKLKISIGQAFQPFTVLSEMFTGIATKITNFAGRLNGLSKIFTPFLSIGSSMFKLFGMIVKFAGPIGLVVNVIQFAFSLFKRFSEMKWGDSIGENILLGIKAIGGALYDVLIQPFVDLWIWLKEKFIANSPSKLGLGIVEGIKSVGSMLIDALTWPFRTVFNFVSGLFGGDGELGSKIVEGVKSIGEFMFDALTWPFRKLIGFVSKIPFIGKLFGRGNADASANVTVEAQVKSSAQPASTVEVTGLTELKETVDKLVDAITKLGGVAGGGAPVVNVNNNSTAMAEKLDELIGLLKSGVISVNMDGILVSKALAKTS